MDESILIPDGGTVQFTVAENEEFYVAVSDQLTVYEAYEDAVADIDSILKADEDAFLAEMSIDHEGDDVGVNLEQVAWPQIIKDMD